MRKTRRSRGRSTEFDVIDFTLVTDQPAEFHTRENLNVEERNNFRALLYDGFPELL
jgi:hypothetical protein